MKQTLLYMTMKKITVLLVALLLTTIGGPAYARKSQKEKTELHQKKADIKEWKQKKNDMEPLQLKDLVEENHRLKTSNRKLEEDLKVSTEELEKLLHLKLALEVQEKGGRGAQNGGGRGGAKGGESASGGGYWHEGGDEDADGEQNGDATGGAHSNLVLSEGMMGGGGFTKKDWAIGKNGQFYIKGLVFKVQIGAYRKRDLSNVLEGANPQEAFEQEKEEDINKYTIRHFRDYWKADKFKKELRAMGVKETWIVSFKDGERVPLKEVLQEVIKKK
jgi:hypothetical protein